MDHLTGNIHACIYADCQFLSIQLECAVGKKCKQLSIEQFVKLFNSGNFKNTEVKYPVIIKPVRITNLVNFLHNQLMFCFCAYMYKIDMISKAQISTTAEHYTGECLTEMFFFPRLQILLNFIAYCNPSLCIKDTYVESLLKLSSTR